VFRSIPRVIRGVALFRITNIRGNAFALGVAGVNATPTPIVETIVTTPAQLLPVVGSPSTVAFHPERFYSAVNSVPSFSQCVSQNKNLADDPNQSGTPQVAVNLSENFATGFKKRNVATSPATPTALAIQNDLRVGAYNTESSFYNPTFPIISGRGNLGLAGLADNARAFC